MEKQIKPIVRFAYPQMNPARRNRNRKERRKKKFNHYEMFSRYLQRLIKPEACFSAIAQKWRRLASLPTGRSLA
jgi:hypothetical protein